jgi:hypothetical protein
VSTNRRVANAENEESKMGQRQAINRLNAAFTAMVGIYILTGACASAAEIVQNGSFEALNGTFVDDSENYMSLDNGSTFITGWTVSTSSGAVVLGRSPTGDGYTAANGEYFVDLSGFGSSSPDGALNQTITTVGGATYAFSMDLAGANNGTVSASVGGNSLVLTPGTPFNVGGTEWIPETGTFVGDFLDMAPLLSITNETPGSDIDFVDNVSISGAAATPEPSTWAMMLLGFATLLGYAAYCKAKSVTVFPA